MKYGESAFDLLYLLFAVLSGCLLLARGKDREARCMGLAALVLGCGDAFHLVPRVLNSFVSGDLTAALGVGKLITSVTMTVFYLLLYSLWRLHYGRQEGRGLRAALWVLAAVRIVLCLLPQNGWLENRSDVLWGVVRNVPFVLLGAAVCFLYFRERRRDRVFRFLWLYILLSFLFYLPVVVAAGLVPMLGMLMLPKTVCYILMIAAFLRAAKKGRA